MAEINMKIHAFEDGDDFVLVFEKASPDLKNMIIGLLSPVMEAAAEAEPKKEEPVMVDFFGQGQRSVQDILNEDGDRGYANLVYLCNNGMDEVLKGKVQMLLNGYRRVRFPDDVYTYVDGLSEEEVNDIFRYYMADISFNVKSKLLAQAGKRDFTDNPHDPDICQAADEAFRKYLTETGISLRKSALAEILAHFKE